MNYNFESILLRSSLETDLTFICRLEGDIENSRFISAWSAEKHKATFYNDDFCHLVVESDGIAVGFVILAGLKNPNKSIEFMRDVINEKGNGLGHRTLQAVKALSFTKLNVH